MIALEKNGCEVACFSPDRPQRDVIDHAAGRPAPEGRGILAESARIARGKIAPLSGLDAAAFDGVAFPGGFGAAKNLCDFAIAGTDMKVEPDVERVLAAFRGKGKPILAVCIAPALVAKAFGAQGVKFTIGGDAGTAQALSSFGGTHVATDKAGVCVDEKLRIVTAPAYMMRGARPESRQRLRRGRGVRQNSSDHSCTGQSTRPNRRAGSDRPRAGGRGASQRRSTMDRLAGGVP
jgi:enhancing lycopene biosynthesis protein 2